MQLPPNLPSRYTRLTSASSNPVAEELLRKNPPKIDTLYEEADIDPQKLLRPGAISWKDEEQRRHPVFNVHKAPGLISAAKNVGQKDLMQSLAAHHKARGKGNAAGLQEEFKMHKANVAVEAAGKAAAAAETAKQAAAIAKTNADENVAEKAAETAVKAAAKAQADAATAVEVAKEAVAEASEKKAAAKSALGYWEPEYEGIHGWTSDVEFDGWFGEGTGGGMKKILCCLACTAVGAGIGIYLAKNGII